MIELTQTKGDSQNKKPRIYVAGPMSGLPDFNRSAFRTAAEILREMDFEVVTPADCYSGDTWEEGMRHDIPAMLSCDAVVVLGEWEKSRGARLEVFIARELGMPVETLGQLLVTVKATLDHLEVSKPE